MWNHYIFGGGAVGGWKELARTTLGSNSSTLDVSSLSNKRYYMTLFYGGTTASAQPWFRFNSDSGSTYSNRYQINGGADGTSVNDTSIYPYQTTSTNDFGIHYIANYSTKEKLVISNSIEQSTAGAGNAPARREMVSKWANTSNAISSVNYIMSSDSLTSGSEVVVLGWDPADTHSNNFWTELASTTLTSASSTLSSGTFTAKKYLWIQAYIITGTELNSLFRFNGDTANNYSNRQSRNGGVDSTNTSIGHANIFSTYAVPAFINMFVVNVSSKEKLVIGHLVQRNTAGAGNAPNREEFVFKWANTSSQITDATFTGSSGNIGSGSIIKVWGSD